MAKPVRKRRWVLRIALAGLLVLVTYFLAWPTPIDPVGWNPPAAPALEGVFDLNTDLADARLMGVGVGRGPETVAVHPHWGAFAGYEDGRVMRFPHDDSAPVEIVNTQGRPLGLAFDPDGRLVIADAWRGLLRFDLETETLVTLADRFGNELFRFTDDVTVARDGTIYFTDASTKFAIDEYIYDFLEHRPHGRLYAFDPTTAETRLLLDDLYFANGVALAPDESFLVVNETGAYRARRLWLSGERAGETDTLIENLPGFPDGISAGANGVYWIALVSPRDAVVDWCGPRPFVREVFARAPAWAQPATRRHGFILGVTADGEVVYNLQDPTGERIWTISAVTEHEGSLYLGTLEMDAFGILAVP
ncbi:MAG: SMP-30/gluconolactonase/LRE family protein [Phycisphaerales bacterium]